MPFHRLVAQTYLGGLPGTHDFINDPSANGDAGAPATVSTGKLTTSGHPNEGTYYVGFGNDGTSSEANRPHDALAENCDFLDDVVSAQMPVVDHVDGVAGSDISSLQLTGDVFMGMTGVYANTQDFRDRLVAVLDSTTFNELVDANGVKINVSSIRDATNTTNRVGAAVSPGGDFETNPVVNFNPPIPSGSNYRIVFARRSSLVAALRTGTNRDFTVRTAIRASHEVAAEVVRFMTQASRRLGGNIQALVATIIETPGIGDNILPAANALVMDVDPDNSAGPTGGGLFDVRFDRDGTPAVNFRVGEADSLAGVESFWENVAERLNLTDPNVRGSGFTSTLVAFSSSVSGDGDQSLRIMERDPALVGEPVSILKALNARHTVTVGNGSTTFGDFNGITAVNDAVAAYLAAPVGSGLTIYVKSGSYLISAITMSAGLDLTIIGESANTCLFANNTAGVAIQGSSTSTAILKVSGIHFTRNSTGNIALAAGPSRLIVEDCYFDNQAVQYTQSSSVVELPLHINRCRAQLSATVSGTPFLTMRVTGTPTAVGSYIVEKSTISVASEAAVVSLLDSGAGSGALLGSIIIRDCALTTASTTTTASNPTSVVGVFGVDPSGGSSSLLVRRVVMENLDVTINSSSTNRIALYLRTGDGGLSVFFDEVIIKGGRWDFGSSSSVITPIYIGGQDYDTQDINRVRIEDVVMGFTGTTSIDYGDAAAEVNFPGANDAWAAVYVTAFDRVTVKNVTWLTATWEASCGEFFFFQMENLDVDGIYIRSFVNTATIGAPNYRVRIEGEDGGDQTQVLQAHRIVVEGANAAGVPADGFITLVPYTPILLADCVIGDWTGGGVHGVVIENVDDLAKSAGVTISRCRIANGGGRGISYSHGGGANDAPLVDAIFEHNTIDSCFQGGIVLTGTSTGTPRAFRNVIVNGNICRDSGSSRYGIEISPGVWSEQQDVIVTNNVCYNNDGGASGVQIQFGNTGTANGAGAEGVCQGNACGEASLNTGQIFFTGGGPAPVDLVGSETGYSTAVNPTQFTNRTHTVGNDMMQNRAWYAT